jgi:hypothetical protein
MPALQAPEDWANTGAVPATANAASARASEPYLLALKFFMSHLLLPIIARGFRAKRSAALAAPLIRISGESGVCYGRYVTTGVLLWEVSQARDLTDAGKKIKELEISVCCS